MLYRGVITYVDGCRRVSGDRIITDSSGLNMSVEVALIYSSADNSRFIRQIRYTAFTGSTFSNDSTIQIKDRIIFL